ncbi:restriction endonuclease subunit S [Mesorhizobium sp. M0622]|uniref:hypothetical protein n=1 Tax=Mesorhizobium sp. M0622 TaxID=2956975 RepID=UPI003338A7BB
MSGLPEGWCEAKLEDLAVVNPGRLEGVWSGATVSFVPMPAVSDVEGEIVSPSVRPFAEVSKGYTQFQERDVIFAKITPCMENGKIAVARSLENGVACGSTEFHIVRPLGGISADYIWRYLRQKSFRDDAEASMTGAVGQRRVPATYLKESQLPLPPLPEQRRIVTKIDGLTGKSKRARDHLDHIPRLVEKYKQAVLAAAFRGDLTREWRAAQPNGVAGGIDALTRVRDERNAARVRAGLRSKGRNRSVPSKVVNLVKLPRTWTWLTFDDCSWDMTVGHVGPMKDRYVAEGIAFLRSLNVRANRIDLRKVVFIDEAFSNELKKSRLHPGDLVVVRTGEPGVAAVIPPELAEANCSDLVICRLISSANPHFAAYYMNSDYAKSVVAGFQVGVAQQHFNVGAMSEMPLPFAPIEEQAEIVRRIEIAFTWIKRLASEATSASKLIDHLDQSVLAKAFRGELVSQDPADEPAVVLLERIKAERSVAPQPRRGRRVTS